MSLGWEKTITISKLDLRAEKSLKLLKELKEESLRYIDV